MRTNSPLLCCTETSQAANPPGKAEIQKKRNPVRSCALAGNPRGGPLKFPTVGDGALLAARHKLENDLLAPFQPSLSVVLGGGKDQPVSLQNLVRPVFFEESIAAVVAHLQRRGLAMASLAINFRAHAGICAGNVLFLLRPSRRCHEDQPDHT